MAASQAWRRQSLAGPAWEGAHWPIPRAPPAAAGTARAAGRHRCRRQSCALEQAPLRRMRTCQAGRPSRAPCERSRICRRCSAAPALPIAQQGPLRHPGAAADTAARQTEAQRHQHEGAIGAWTQGMQRALMARCSSRRLPSGRTLCATCARLLRRKASSAVSDGADVLSSSSCTSPGPENAYR